MRNRLKKVLRKFLALCYRAVGDREAEWLAYFDKHAFLQSTSIVYSDGTLVIAYNQSV